MFNLDRLNVYKDVQPRGDGFFDFVPGITVNTQGGQIIFTKVEPFGEYLFNLLGGGTYDAENDQGYNENQQKYVFQEHVYQNQISILAGSGKKPVPTQGSV